MAQVILGAVGGAIGGGVGRALGALAGAQVDRLAVASLTPPRQRGPRLETLHLQSSAEGAPMATVFGRARVTGQVIWAARFLERRHEHSAGKGGPKTVDYTYSLSFAVALCEGPIDGVGRIWADGQPMNLTDAVTRVHLGGEAQQPDPLIEAVEGGAPAYRGAAYIVFEDLPLGPYGNRAPHISAEVFRRPRGAEPRLEDRLEGVCLIPGAGEFALAVEPVMRREGLTRSHSENIHNLEARPDLLVSLDQLQAQCPNLRRATLVVGWFGDDLRAGECRIRPGVERVDKSTAPLEWSVAGVGRADAHVVSQHDGEPAYGGTPADAAVVQAVAELKARGLEVTLCPFMFMDIPLANGRPDPYGGVEQAAYPWRGRITGSDGSAAATAEIAAFFGGPEDWGLRRMARHYAALAASTGADGLLIGSELRGVTTLRDASGGYPAVALLKTLAAECRAVAGRGVSLSYAADWSEYFGHQPADGSGDVVFHLDPLWADQNIDYVGIDWYPPLADWRDGSGHLDAIAGYPAASDPAYLAANVAGGEGFDWFYASAEDRAVQTRTPITDGAYGEPWVFRPKDLVGWWSNLHHDRAGGVRAAQSTAWVPGLKPIRLTEFGCAAVDRGANAPNLFRDPKSAESALPPFSDGSRDDLMQRRALEALLIHFAEPANNPVSPGYGGPMLVALDAWCWDARPYPDFPARPDVWADAGNWTAGHWLNGRLAGEGRDLIRAVLRRGGLEDADIAIVGVDGALAGYVIDRPMRVRDSLEPLLLALGAEAVEQDGRIVVVGGVPPTADLQASALARPDEGPSVRATRVLEPAPESVRVRFIDEAADYQTGAIVLRSPTATGGGGVDADLPAVCSSAMATAMAQRVLARAEAREVLTLSLGPLDALRLEPGDGATIEDHPGNWRIRRIDLDEQPRAELALAVETPRAAGPETWRPGEAPGLVGRPWFEVLDLPPLPAREEATGPRVALAAEPWRAMDVNAGATANLLTPRARIASPATVGILLEPLGPGIAHRWTHGAGITLKLEGAAPQSRPQAAVLAGLNALAVRAAGGGWEIIQFQEAEPLGPDVWRLRGLLRGQQGTDEEMRQGAPAGAAVVMLDDALVAAELAPAERGLPMVWRAGPAGAPPGGSRFAEVQTVVRGVQSRPWAPAHLRARSQPDGAFALDWAPRARLDGDRWDGEPGQPDAPERFRLRILENSAARRTWEVETRAAVYLDAWRQEDFPAGLGPGVWAEVAQWSPTFGWGAAARRQLAP